MKRIDTYILFRLGGAVSKLKSIDYWGFDGKVISHSEAASIYQAAHTEIMAFLAFGPFPLKMTSIAGRALIKELDRASKACRDEEKKDLELTYEIGQPVNGRLTEFETLLRAELANANVYAVDKKQAFDTETIIFFGESAFPARMAELGEHVIQDAKSAMRCIAFELPTAAAFHLHRLNEVVLGLYWDHVTEKPRPKNPTLGAYIAELKKEANPDENVLSALDQIRGLHRNPTMHADYTYATTEEAIALFGIVASAISYMLSTIPPKPKDTKTAIANALASPSF